MRHAAPMTHARAEFPVLDEGLRFLDWGATGLVPERTRRALHDWVDRVAGCAGGTSTWIHGEGAEVRGRVRSGVARELGVGDEEIAIVESTSAALGLASRVVPARPGDNVVLLENDYLAVAMPWRHRAEREGLELRLVPAVDGAFDAEAILSRVDERTAAVAHSTVAWTSGARTDLAAIGEGLAGHRAAWIVDGVQSFGVAHHDLAGISRVDFFCAGGHKWLCSPLGAGFLRVSPEAARRFDTPDSGFLSAPGPRGPWFRWFEDPRSRLLDPVSFPPLGRSFEVGGTPSYPGAIGLDGFLSLLDEVGGTRAVQGHVATLRARLVDGLITIGWQARPIGGGGPSAITVLGLEGGQPEEAALAARLGERRLLTSVRYAGGAGGLRVSLHAMNDEGDVDALLEALGEEARSGTTGVLRDRARA